MKIVGTWSARVSGVLFFVYTALGSSNLDVARQVNQAFVEVAERVIPTVVVITVRQNAPEFSDPDSADPDDLSPRDFRRRYPRRFRDDFEEYIGSGSGVIIRKDGYIVTNRHVVENADRIEVRLKDGRRFKATIRGVDAQSDLAVIKIEAQDLPVAKLADSDRTRVGELAMAIGAPYQFDYSVTFGHVSAKSRENVLPRGFGGASLDQDYLQTDANINPGNSGGPLVNLEGEIIGINTIIRGVNTGIGFAIPSTLVKDVTDQLIAEGRFTRAWLGVSIVALREEENYRELLKSVQEGVVVRAILPGGPASRSDLRASDVIVAVDGKAVTTPQELRNEIRRKKIGSPARLTVHRNGADLPIEIHPAEWVLETPARPGLAGNRAPGTNAPVHIGLEVRTLTPELIEKFKLTPTIAGVIVVSVDRKGLAHKVGIQPGDVITAINHQPMASPRHFSEAMQTADLKRGVIVNLISSDMARFEILQQEDGPSTR